MALNFTISKSFDPTSVSCNQASKLTITVQNQNDSDFDNIAFTDNLPTGLVIANPANIFNGFGFGSGLTATSGTSLISLTSGTIAANSSETLEVDVVGATPGNHTNTVNLTSPVNANGSADLMIQDDVEAPVITLVGPNPQTILQCNPYVELGATATDNCDGDITDDIVIDNSSVDTKTPGSYDVTYASEDAAGNFSQQIREVIVVSNPVGSITIKKRTNCVEGAFKFIELSGKIKPFTIFTEKYKGIKTFTNLPIGIYKFEEVHACGWVIDGVKCNAQISSFGKCTNVLEIDLQTCEDVVCTFFNEKCCC